MVKRSLWRLGCLCVLLFALVMGEGCGCEPSVTIARCKNAGDCAKYKDKCKATGCICKDEVCVPKKGVCKTDGDCESGEKCVVGKCAPSRCKTDDDCPDPKKPRCDKVLGVCKGKRVGDACDGTDECPKDTKCCRGDSKEKVCNYPKCFKDADCRKGEASADACIDPIDCNQGIKPSCVQGTCKCTAPCGGGQCSDGKCCDAKQDQCVENPKPCPGLSCKPGEGPPDFSKYTIDAKTCGITGPECKCVKLPPLEPGDSGIDSEIGLLSGKVILSGYNKTYGDLVVGIYDGSKVTWEFIDGIPSGGKIEGATDGPRGGVKEPGDDVGRHTSIAVGGSTVHVSYQDATNGHLKYAGGKPGSWKTHVVDKNGKVVGRFTSITMAGTVPVIAYFVADDGKGKSALRVARAKNATPASAADWDIKTVDSADKPACKGLCDAKKKETCVSIGGKPTCKVPTAAAKDCKPKACKDGEEACVGGKCEKIVPDDPNPPLPKGVGLFVSITALPSGGTAVAYYDANKGDLKVAVQATSGGNYLVKSVKTKGDVGQFPSIAFAQGALHVAYIDVENADVRYLKLNTQGAPSVDELVDNGFANTPGGGEDRLLADCSIAVTSSGQVRIIYQDASVQSLRVAVRQGANRWRKVKMAGEGSPKGAFGFFADQVLEGAKSHVSNYKYDLSQKQGNAIDLRTWQ